ncbi:zinc finger protein, putative [Plasmodium ovale]|uniref:Zinc finger protein, putative n=2 Tax=Plasmodium ovale TaxID=36330 RepID=A0A1A8VUS9_PLAOA|nr:zinc finger protein, putative [Plasmodium ovale curtisi]SCQ16437.1 zinc finger protein, putative [Plasmodium ovale]
MDCVTYNRNSNDAMCSNELINGHGDSYNLYENSNADSSSHKNSRYNSNSGDNKQAEGNTSRKKPAKFSNCEKSGKEEIITNNGKIEEKMVKYVNNCTDNKNVDNLKMVQGCFANNQRNNQNMRLKNFSKNKDEYNCLYEEKDAANNYVEKEQSSEKQDAYESVHNKGFSEFSLIKKGTSVNCSTDIENNDTIGCNKGKPFHTHASSSNVNVSESVEGKYGKNGFNSSRDVLLSSTEKATFGTFENRTKRRFNHQEKHAYPFVSKNREVNNFNDKNGKAYFFRNDDNNTFEYFSRSKDVHFNTKNGHQNNQISANGSSSSSNNNNSNHNNNNNNSNNPNYNYNSISNNYNYNDNSNNRNSNNSSNNNLNYSGNCNYNYSNIGSNYNFSGVNGKNSVDNKKGRFMGKSKSLNRSNIYERKEDFVPFAATVYEESGEGKGYPNMLTKAYSSNHSKLKEKKMDTSNFISSREGNYDFKSALNFQFCKTKMCPYMNTREKCKRFSNNMCPYAHDKSELKPIPNLYKTAMCRNFMKNMCFMSKKECNFAHHVEELRSTDEFYKTTLCKFFLNGYCKADKNCRHAHGPKELKCRPIGSALLENGKTNGRNPCSSCNEGENCYDNDDDNYYHHNGKRDDENCDQNSDGGGGSDSGSAVSCSVNKDMISEAGNPQSPVNKDPLTIFKSSDEYGSLNESKGSNITGEEETMSTSYDMEKDKDKWKKERFYSTSRKLMSLSTKDTCCLFSSGLSKNMESFEKDYTNVVNDSSYGNHGDDEIVNANEGSDVSEGTRRPVQEGDDSSRIYMNRQEKSAESLFQSDENDYCDETKNKEVNDNAKSDVGQNIITGDTGDSFNPGELQCEKKMSDIGVEEVEVAVVEKPDVMEKTNVGSEHDNTDSSLLESRENNSMVLIGNMSFPKEGAKTLNGDNEHIEKKKKNNAFGNYSNESTMYTKMEIVKNVRGNINVKLFERNNNDTLKNTFEEMDNRKCYRNADINSKNMNSEMICRKGTRVTNLSENNGYNYNGDLVDNSSGKKHEYDNIYGTKDDSALNLQVKKNFTYEYKKNGYKNRRNINAGNYNNSSNYNYSYNYTYNCSFNGNHNHGYNSHNNGHYHSYNNSDNNNGNGATNKFNDSYNSISKNHANSRYGNTDLAIQTKVRLNHNKNRSSNPGSICYSYVNSNSNGINNVNMKNSSMSNISINNGNVGNSIFNNHFSKSYRSSNRIYKSNSSNYTLRHNTLLNNCIRNSSTVDRSINSNKNLENSKIEQTNSYHNRYGNYRCAGGNVNRYMSVSNFRPRSAKQNIGYDVVSAVDYENNHYNSRSNSNGNGNNNRFYEHECSSPTVNENVQSRILLNSTPFETSYITNTDDNSKHVNISDRNGERVACYDTNVTRDSNWSERRFNSSDHLHNVDNPDNRHNNIFCGTFKSSDNRSGNSGGNRGGNNAKDRHLDSSRFPNEYTDGNMNMHHTYAGSGGNDYGCNVDRGIYNIMHSVTHNNVYIDTSTDYKNENNKIVNSYTNSSVTVNVNNLDIKNRKGYTNNNDFYCETFNKNVEDKFSSFINGTRTNLCNTNMKNETILQNDNLPCKKLRYYFPTAFKNEKRENRTVSVTEECKKNINDKHISSTKNFDFLYKHEKEYNRQNKEIEKNRSEERENTTAYCEFLNTKDDLNALRDDSQGCEKSGERGKNTCDSTNHCNSNSSNNNTFKTLTSLLSPWKVRNAEEGPGGSKALPPYEVQKKNYICEKNNVQGCSQRNGSSHGCQQKDTQGGIPPNDHKRNRKIEKYRTKEELKTCVSCYQYIKSASPSDVALIEASCIKCGQLIKKSVCQMIIEMLKPQVQNIFSDVNFYVQYYQD